MGDLGWVELQIWFDPRFRLDKRPGWVEHLGGFYIWLGCRCCEIGLGQRFSCAGLSL